MERVYISDKRFDYEPVEVFTGVYEGNTPIYKTVLDVWYIQGIRYTESHYFGQYNSIKELKQTIIDCEKQEVF